MWSHIRCSPTSQYRFVAAVASRGVLARAALPAHDAVILRAEGLLGQVLVALGTAEAVLMPVAAFMAQLLHWDGEREREREG